MLNDISQGDGVNQFFELPKMNQYPDLSGQPVLFHGVNKSGSLACASVLQKAYEAHGRKDQFMCRYFGIPDNLDKALVDFKCAENNSNHSLLIDHNLVGRSSDFPMIPYITLLRSPVRRMLSCYYWLKSHHTQQLRNRDFNEWLKDAALAYSLVFQFACFEGATKEVKVRIHKLPPEEVKKMAEDWFDENVASYGITEYFEESVFLLSNSLGLPSVPAWQPDKRNVLRPPWEDISPEQVSHIEEMISFDMAFYEERVARLKPDFEHLNHMPEFLSYKSACAEVRNDQERSI